MSLRCLLRDAPVMRTASAAAKPCQGDSLELYLITGSTPDDCDEVLKLKNFKKDATLKLFKSTKQERYEHTKAKKKITEPEKPLKKKDQILIDEEIAQRLQEELQAELEEEERLARQKEEDANIAEWDNIQAMIDADYELAARL
ncbi:hypothetical protein Tco_1220191 [Tanacetum coccineum]